MTGHRKPTGHWPLPVGRPLPSQPAVKVDSMLTAVKAHFLRRTPPQKRERQALFLLSRLRGSAITKAIPDSMDVGLGHHPA